MKKKKIISIILIIIQLLTILSNLNTVKANIKEGDTILLQGDHECDSLVEYWMASHNKWSYKIVWYVYYIDAETGSRYPAFCIEPAKEGVGTGYTSYNGTIFKENDPVIWRILSKGYMGSNYKEWNLECDDDFYSATKIALHSYAEKVAPKAKYILGNRSVDGNTVEEIQRRGEKALNVAQTLYEYGINGKEQYQAPQVSINKNGDKKVEIINGEEYYIQNYKVTGNKTLKSYKISIENFVSGTKILDSNNKEISSSNNSNFKIAIPTKNIKESINGKINIKEAEIKTCPVYLAKSSISEAQSYVTYTGSYEKADTSINMQVDPNNCSLVLTKIDSETKKPLSNVTFEITKQNGEKLGEYITNEKGVIELNNLKPGLIKIKEIKVDDRYILNGGEQQILLQWGKTTKIEIENNRKKGSLKIVKIDSKNEEIKLEGVEFELYNDKKELVNKVITNEKGEAVLENLYIGKYYLKEIRTNEEYILNEKEIEVQIEWNNETQKVIKNSKKQGSLNIVKVDNENKEIKIEGVKFKLYDSKGNCIDTYITNKDGKITIEKLDIGSYVLKEVQTNEKYILNEEKTEVQIEWNNETKITIENSRKKGNLKIVKIDSEDKEIKLEGVEFELYDSNENYIDKFVTNEDGEVIIEKLDIGSYIVKEVKTNEKYILNKNEIEAQIEWNKETKLEIENEKIKGQIKITKLSEDDNKITGKKAGTPIANVEFEIRDEKGNIVQKVITNKEGIAITEKLEKGKYYIKETKTDENYELNNNIYTIEIAENEQIENIQITNKSKNKLPRTGF